MNAIHISLPFKTALTIRTNDSHIIQLLQLNYGDYLSPCTVEGDRGHIDVIQSGDCHIIRYNGDIQHTTQPFRAINDILYAQPFDSSVVAFHGGAVEYNNGAYLFLAPTTSGKTTLTAYLTAQGATYLTDDCILIDEHHRVHPFTTPIHLRKGGYEILKALGCLPKDTAFMDDPSMMRHVFTPNNRMTAPVPLRHIFFISRTDTENIVHSMTTTEKMTALMHSPIKDYPLNAPYLSRIAALTPFPCERLYYSDMAYVWEVMQRG